MKRIQGDIVDVRVFYHTEQSELVFTLCVEQRHGDTRLEHDDFYLTLAEMLALKASINQIKLEERSEVAE